MNDVLGALTSGVTLPAMVLLCAVFGACLLGFAVGSRKSARRVRALTSELTRETRRIRRQRDDLETAVKMQREELEKGRRRQTSRAA
ncbi:MAG: hypothetical protein AAF577_15115 [Pseudomonadota bacterium]